MHSFTHIHRYLSFAFSAHFYCFFHAFKAGAFTAKWTPEQKKEDVRVEVEEEEEEEEEIQGHELEDVEEEEVN